MGMNGSDSVQASLNPCGGPAAAGEPSGDIPPEPLSSKPISDNPSN
jgi:hypothetical protein